MSFQLPYFLIQGAVLALEVRDPGRPHEPQGKALGGRVNEKIREPLRPRVH